MANHIYHTWILWDYEYHYISLWYLIFFLLLLCHHIVHIFIYALAYFLSWRGQAPWPAFGWGLARCVAHHRAEVRANKSGPLIAWSQDAAEEWPSESQGNGLGFHMGYIFVKNLWDTGKQLDIMRLGYIGCVWTFNWYSPKWPWNNGKDDDQPHWNAGQWGQLSHNHRTFWRPRRWFASLGLDDVSQCLNVNMGYIAVYTTPQFYNLNSLK